jgi:hypothetical protein
MLHLLSEAGRSFLRAFGGSLLILLPGVLSSPDFGTTRGLAVAALIASVTAGLKAIQVFVPRLSFASVIHNAYYVVADSFARAFLGTFITLVIGLLSAPEFHVTRAALIAVLVGAVTAGIRAIQGFLSNGDVPSPPTGF